MVHFVRVLAWHPREAHGEFIESAAKTLLTIGPRWRSQHVELRWCPEAADATHQHHIHPLKCTEAADTDGAPGDGARGFEAENGVLYFREHTTHVNIVIHGALGQCALT